MHYLGIEIGGTKLQVGLGPGDGKIAALWRGRVEPAEGADGIRRQLQEAVPHLLREAGVATGSLRGCGIGFGGPVNDQTRTILRSHQIDGWDDFPLADWISDLIGVDAVLGNDADVAGLAEALHGAGNGLSPIFYVTIGSGIGGGLIIDGQIYRGTGKGAAEIGHLKVFRSRLEQEWWLVDTPGRDLEYEIGTLESAASGWALEQRIRTTARNYPQAARGLLDLVDGDAEAMDLRLVARAARAGDRIAQSLFSHVLVDSLATGLNRIITLLCPRRIVIGGGVSQLGDDLLFDPLRRLLQVEVDERFAWEPPFAPFLGETDIVPAVLGEEVVIHGAIALARQRLGGSP